VPLSSNTSGAELVRSNTTMSQMSGINGSQNPMLGPGSISSGLLRNDTVLSQGSSFAQPVRPGYGGYGGPGRPGGFRPPSPYGGPVGYGAPNRPPGGPGYGG